jgi:hypothetical protein
MAYGVAFARQQRVDVHATLCRQLLEAPALEFVGNKDFALLGGQLTERSLQFVEEQRAHVERFRSVIVGRQHLVNSQQLALFVYYRKIRKGLRLPLAKKIRNAIARNPKQPAGYVVDRLEKAISLDQFKEDFLKQVFDVRFIGNAGVGALPRSLRKSAGLARPSKSRSLVHPPIAEDGWGPQIL